MNEQLAKAYQKGLELVGQYDPDLHDEEELTNITLDILENTEHEFLEGLGGSTKELSNYGDDDFPDWDSREIAGEISDRLPEDVKEFFYYGFGEHGGYLGLIPHEEYENDYHELITGERIEEW